MNEQQPDINPETKDYDECDNRGHYKIAMTPKEITEHLTLTLAAKLLYGVINALTDQKGYCFASNEFFCKSIAVSLKTIKVSLKQLDDLDYIERRQYKKKINGEWHNSRYIYTTVKRQPEKPKEKVARVDKKIFKLSDEDLKYFEDMWRGYTLEYVCLIRNKESGKYRRGGSKSDAKNKFRTIRKAGISKEVVEDFVRANMNIDFPADLQRLLKIEDLKEIVKDIKTNGTKVSLEDIVTGEIVRLTEDEAVKKESKRWKRV